MDDPFAILGLPRQFNINSDELQQRFIAAAAKWHPDRSCDPLEQSPSAEMAARVNEAYRLLSDPETRANVLLELMGGLGSEHKKINLPPQVMAEMMDKREKLEDATTKGDHEQIKKIQAWIANERKARLERIGKWFEPLEHCQNNELKTHPAVERDEIIGKIRMEIDALRYVTRLGEHLSF